MNTSEENLDTTSTLQSQFVLLQKEMDNIREKIESLARYQSFLESNKHLDSVNKVKDKVSNDIADCCEKLQSNGGKMLISLQGLNEEIDGCLAEVRTDVGSIIAQNLLENKKLRNNEVDNDSLQKEFTYQQSEQEVLKHVLDFLRKIAILTIKAFPDDFAEFSQNDEKELSKEDIRVIIVNSPLVIVKDSLYAWMAGRSVMKPSTFEARVLNPLLESNNIGDIDAECLRKLYLKARGACKKHQNGIVVDMNTLNIQQADTIAQSVKKYKNTIRECIITLYNFIKEEDEGELQIGTMPLIVISERVHQKIKQLLGTKRNGRPIISTRSIARWLVADRAPSYGGFKNEYILRLQSLGKLSDEEADKVLKLLAEARGHYINIKNAEKKSNTSL